MNCCWLPLMVLPEMAESEMNPPRGELRAGRAEVHQRQAAVDLHPAHRRGLRDRPELVAGLAAGLAHHVDGQVRHRAPEVHQRGAVGRGARRCREALVQHVDRAVDLHVGRVAAEAGDLGVVADVEPQRLRRRPVRARLEQQREPAGAELVGDLPGGDRVDRGLDLRLRHARVEDQHVGAEVRVARRRGGGRRLRCGGRRGGRRGCLPGECTGGQEGGDDRGREPDPEPPACSGEVHEDLPREDGSRPGRCPPPRAPVSPPRHRSGGRVASTRPVHLYRAGPDVTRVPRARRGRRGYRTPRRPRVCLPGGADGYGSLPPSTGTSVFAFGVPRPVAGSQPRRAGKPCDR